MSPFGVPVWAATGFLSRGCPCWVAPPRVRNVCPHLLSRLGGPRSCFHSAVPAVCPLLAVPDGCPRWMSPMDGPAWGPPRLPHPLQLVVPQPLRSGCVSPRAVPAGCPGRMAPRTANRRESLLAVPGGWPRWLFGVPRWMSRFGLPPVCCLVAVPIVWPRLGWGMCVPSWCPGCSSR